MTDIPNHDTVHKFSADRPISSLDQDLLGRSDFARAIATAILAWKGKDSLVLALYGAWGSGKTSVKNMVLDILRKDKAASPAIVEFNPWQWAGQEQIAQGFFNEIGLSLGKTDRNKKRKKWVARWKHYAAHLKIYSSLAETGKKILFWLIVITGAFGLMGNYIKIPWIQNVVLLVILFSGITAAALQWGGKLSDQIAEVFEKFQLAHEKTLPELKQELREFLLDLKQPIIVVIDDIDRLSKDEMKYLFQLVKANADFPNMVYLLLFQRDIVEKSLEAFAPAEGKEYLEKIVQVGFDMPRMERNRLEKVLLSGLDELLGVEGVEKRFDKIRWGNIYHSGVNDYLQTLRDVHRYLGMLSFHIGLFRNKKAFEVNPLDLIALEVFSVFEPDVYAQIANSKDELTKPHGSLGSGGNNAERNNKVLTSIADKAAEDKQAQVRKILIQLFPYMENVGYGEGFTGQWYRDLRVCHPQVFDRYFQLAIPTGDISQSELDDILNLAGDRNNLVNKFRQLNERGLLGTALDRLEAYKGEMDIQYAVPFISALFDIGDELPEGASDSFYFEFGPAVHAYRIVYWYLKQEKDIAKRERILLEAAQKSTGLYLVMYVTSPEYNRKDKKKEPNDCLIVDDTVLEKLKTLCLERIRIASTDGALEKHSSMLSVLYQWREWASPDEPSAWVAKLVESDRGVLIFLTALLQKSTSQTAGDYIAKVHWLIRMQNIEDFVSATLIAEKVRNIDRTALSEKEQLVLQAFDKALARKEKGISDDNWRHADDD